MGFSSGKIPPNNVDLDSSQTLENKTLDGSTVIGDGATITTPDIIDPSRLDVKKRHSSKLTVICDNCDRRSDVFRY